MNADVSRFTPAAIALHWLLAVLIIFNLCFGLYTIGLPLSPQKLKFFSWHKWVGVTVFILSAARLLWRLGHPVPALPADLPGYQVLAAEATHWALYALLVLQPIIGWIATSAYGAQINFFWLFKLPAIWPHNEPFSDNMFALHRWLGFLMAAILVAHIGAAFFHHFVRKDNILMRMVRG